jgi:hypothetical protein
MSTMVKFTKVPLVDKMWQEFFLPTDFFQINLDAVAMKLLAINNPAMSAWFVIAVLSVSLGKTKFSNTILTFDKGHLCVFNPCQSNDQKKLMKVVAGIPDNDRVKLFGKCKDSQINSILGKIFTAIDNEKPLASAVSNIQDEMPQPLSANRSSLWLPIIQIAGVLSNEGKPVAEKLPAVEERKRSKSA